MGYYTTIEGGLTIEPAIPSKDWPAEACENGANVFLLVEEEGEQELALVNGQIEVVGEPTRLKAVTRYEEPIKAYSADEDVEHIVKWAKKHGSEVNGFLYGIGEDGERWRIRIEKNVTHSEQPELLWPNGDKGWWHR